MSGHKKVSLSEKEAEVLATAWNCFKTPPENDVPTHAHSQVDFEKLAELTDYANPRSVQNLIGVCARAKTTPGSRKRKVTNNDEDGGSDFIASTPSKRGRGMKRTLTKQIVNNDDSESDRKDIAKKDVDLKEETVEGVVD
ncbi:uncharacterized protein F4812DRAFT_453959 [Daldinia caldariorum]|uniref:uncharacterized protein n=1 Tax=Daldinia caldariorum TaxID=326644 RepID=UPI0020087EA1|nr:uncharacterized protein F4812DRAFT_453959 [Daldinia caldariorum]KAI1472144.1 hypothetical protein F4812DRAFT_453959 [Daldinia caldariorum]